MIKKTNEDIKRQLKEKNIPIKLIGNYVDSKKKVQFECDAYHHKFYGYACYVIKTGNCPECSKIKIGEYNRLHQLNKDNLFNVVHPELTQFLANPEDGNKYSYGSNKTVKCICPKCNTTYDKRFTDLSRDGFNCNCDLSRVTNHDEFVTKFHMIFGDKFSVVSQYMISTKAIDIQCNDCGYIFPRTPNNLLSNKTCCCPKCTRLVSKEIVVGTNDVQTTHPEVAKLLKDKSLGTKFKANSNKYATFICPQCGHEQDRQFTTIVQNGFICELCSDKRTYPNKLMGNILDLLKIDYKPEFVIEPYSYRYDFKFIKNNTKYIIEMDGAFNHGVFNQKGNTIEEQISHDKEKDEIAISNGYQIIRIDCKYRLILNRKSHIYNSLKNSILWELLEINEDVYELAHNKAENENILQLISRDWNDGNTDYLYLMNKYKITSRNTLRRYLVRCSSAHLIKESPAEISHITRQNAGKKNGVTRGCPVICNETGIAYYSIAEANRYINGNLQGYFSKPNRKSCGTLPDGTKLTWRKISKEEFNNYINSNTP